MPILPDDIGRLRSIINFNLFAKECAPILELIIIVDNFVVVLCSVQAFFTFKAEEGGDRSADVFMFFLFYLVNLVVDLAHFVELEVLNASATSL